MFLVKSAQVIAVLLASFAVVQAQTSTLDPVDPKQAGNRRLNILLGFKAGPSNYTLTGSEVDLRTSHGSTLVDRSGVELGMVVNLEFFRRIYFRTEATQTQKGGHLQGGGWVYDSPVETNYMTIPAILGIVPIRSKHVAFAFEMGVGYNWSQGSINPYIHDLTTNYYTQTNDFIESYLIGGEFAYIFNSGLRITLNYRYSKDLDYFHVRGSEVDPSIRYELWNEGSSWTVGLLYPVF